MTKLATQKQVDEARIAALKAENAKLREVIAKCDAYIKETSRASGWWNDHEAFTFITTVIEPALKSA